MAYNSTQLPVPSTAGDNVATDEIGGLKFQRIKLTLGDEGIASGDVSSSNPIPTSSGDLVTTAPTQTTPSLPVRQAPQFLIHTSYATAGAGVDSNDETLIRTGTGMAVNRTGGNLVITTGTTANSETVIRSVAAVNGMMTFTVGDTLSQRIAQNNFYRELVDVIGDGLSYNIVSAVVLDVTKTAHGFTDANIGQRMDWCALSSVGVPQEVVILSIPDANTIRFTTVGNPATGSGTCSLTGWNKVELLYTGTTATAVALNTRRKGYQNTSTNATTFTSASGVINFLTMSNDRVKLSNTTPAAGTVITDRSHMFTNIPDPDVELYYQIRAKNGSTAPATTTTWTVAFTRIQDYVAIQTEQVAVRQGGTDVTLPISGTVTATVSNATLAATAAVNLAFPTLVTDVGSAAITTTTTTAAFTPTFGTTYVVNIPVTAVSGTATPSLDVNVEESDDSGTNWYVVYSFPRITATGIYRSPPLTLRGNRVRYVQTIGGTTPSFTRAINRLQRSDDAPLRTMFLDRTIVLNTLNSTTATFYIEGCKDLSVIIRTTALTTGATVALQLSQDGTNFFNHATTISIAAAGIVRQAYLDELGWKFGRLIVTSAGTGITLDVASITGTGG